MWPTAGIKVVLAPLKMCSCTGNLSQASDLQTPGRLRQLLALLLLGDKGIIPAKGSHRDSVNLS